MVGGMDTPGARVDLLRQTVGVGALEFAHRAVLHQHLGQRVILLGQFGKHRFGRGSLALGRLGDDRQTEFLVENHTQLLGRAQVELFTGDLERFALQGDHLFAQFDALDAEQLGIDERALTLDTCQHRHQRHFDVLQHGHEAGHGVQLGLEQLVQAQGDVGVFGGVGAGLFQSDLVEGQLLGTLAGDVGELDGGVVQVLEGQAVHVVPRRGGVEHVGFEHGVEGHAANLNAVFLHAANRTVGQDVHVVLGVLPDLELARVFKQRLERQQYGLACSSFFSQTSKRA